MPALLWLLLACAPHDPPMRPLAAIPFAPPRAGLYASEAGAFLEVQRALVGAGINRAGEVHLQVVSGQPWALSVSQDLIVAPRFLFLDPRATLAGVGVELWGGPIVLKDWEDEDLVLAWTALQLAAMGRELAWSAAQAAHAEGADDALASDHRARDVEWPLLHELVRLGQLPPEAPARYSALLQSLTGAFPPDTARSAAPDEATARRQALMLRGPNLDEPSPLERRAAARAALQYSLERTQVAPVPLATLGERFLSDPQLTTHRVAQGLQVPVEGLEDMRWTAVDGGWEATAGGIGYAVAVDEKADQTRVSVVAPLTVPPAKLAAIAAVLNAANLEEEAMRYALGDGVVVARGPWVDVDGTGAVSQAVRTARVTAGAWMSVLPGVIAGTVTPEQAVRAAKLALPEEE